jgi:hypothetical protein
MAGRIVSSLRGGPPELLLQIVLVRIVAFRCFDGYKIDGSDENVPDQNRWIYGRELKRGKLSSPFGAIRESVSF